MKPIHRYLLAAAVVAVILISLLAAPTVARSTMTDDTTSTALLSQSFTGTPAAVPGQIEAEDYDTGGQGSAWYDRTPGNQGGAYREDDVDIEAGGSGNVIAFVKSSEWLTYSVDVQEAGDYLATFRASSPWNGREVWVWVDGVMKAQVGVPNTGSFDTYEDATANVTLPAGSHVVRLQFVRDSQNLDYFSLEQAGGPTVTPTPTPTETGNVTPMPTVTGTITTVPTSDGGNVTPTPTTTGNVTPTPTSDGNVTPTPTMDVSDLTNQASPLAAMITGDQSTTMLQAPGVPIGLQRVAGNFTSPLFVADAKDGSGRLFLVDQNGYVNIFYMNGTVIDQPFLDIRDRMVNLLPAYDERGLISIAFHPNFSANGKVYAYYSAPLRAGADPSWNCTNRLSEFTVNQSSPDVVDTTTERVLLEVDKPQTNHNGGILLFGPTDKYLYLTLGDGGRADDTGLGHTPGIGNAQDLTKLLGKVIRIDVDTMSEGLQYGIPADNPFLSNASIPPEIYAYGFRNPAFASFDSGGSNRMFIAMAGQNLFESVLVLYKGGAYPWNIREGTHCFDPAMNRTVANTTCSITSYAGQPLIGPVVELGHDVGNTVVGGVVYRGSNLTSLQQGSYIFGTWSNSFTVGDGTLLVATPPAGLDTATLPDDAASLTPEQNAMWTTSELAVANNANGRLNTFVRGMYEGTDGEVLVLINQNAGPGITPQNSGEVWRMVDANTPGLVPIGNGSATNGTPDVQIVQPVDGATVTGSSVDVSVDVTNFEIVDALGSANVVGQGHLHYFMDAEPPTEPGVPAVTEPGTYVPTINTTYTWQNVSPGMHNFSVELVNNNHTPIEPPVVRTVTANVNPAVPGTTTPATGTPTPTATTTIPGLNSSIDLTAQNLAFSLSEITVQAGAQVTVNFNNMDANIPHNFAVYTDSSASTAIFQGQLVTGPTTTTYTFTAPSTAGNYFFRCDVHPEMTGTFVVT